MRNLLLRIGRLPRNFCVSCISFYQATLSPDHGPFRHLYPYGYCRHDPTCSQYGKVVVAERGVLRGIPLLCRRLLLCHPFAKVSDEKVLKTALRASQR